MGPTLTFRTTFSRVIAGVVVAVCVLALVLLAVSGDPASLLHSGGVFALVGVGAWALFWQPLVEVSDGEIVMVNVLRTVHIPWPSVTALDSRWSFSVETTAGTYHAWAAPGSSGMAARWRPSRTTPATDKDSGRGAAASSTGSERISSGGDADAVALAAGERLTKLKEAGFLTEPRADITPTRSWNVPVLVALGVAVAWVVAGALL